MERLRKNTTPDPQREIIERYCSEARQLLEQASTEEEALAIRSRVCGRLAQECESSLVLGATETYVDGLIGRMWQVHAKGATKDA